ncbi:hypothetical protein [Pseudomonas putida]|jgi:hypothetical protein|uniref:hypothetical protein n=1 Tax=Pseudomonas TaxID=286 RepID=UPI0021F8F725|nr:hypothetical protein [Pseudomonas putida]
MTRLALCLLLLATGASATELPKSIQAFNDDERGATCWTIHTFTAQGFTASPTATSSRSSS